MRGDRKQPLPQPDRHEKPAYGMDEVRRRRENAQRHHGSIWNNAASDAYIEGVIDALRWIEDGTNEAASFRGVTSDTTRPMPEQPYGT